MSNKLALIAILAVSLALPATGALARGGGGGGGGGHMGGGGGHMGGGFGGGHMGGFGGGHMGGFGGAHMGSAGSSAWGAAGVHGRAVHAGGARGRRGFGYDNYNSCWNYPYTYGLGCEYPGYY
jgi:hypothetical protein